MMKKINLLKEKIFFLLLLTFQVIVSQNNNGSIDVAGDIVFVAYHDARDGFSFLLLDDAPTGTVISFVDEELQGGANNFGSTTLESELIWQNNTGATIVKGTVIDVFDDTDNVWKATSGTLTENNNVQFGNINYGNFTTGTTDQVYALIGPLTATQTPRSNPTTFLAFIGNNSPIPSTLTEGSTALTISGEGYYTGTTVFNGTITNVSSSINTLGNWTLGAFTFPASVPNTFTGSAFVDNTAPVIGGTVANQGVIDTNTIAPFSSITITDAEGDNLTATITLDDNAKGVLSGIGLSGSGPYTIASATAATMQSTLRASSFNPTDNRAAISETTRFTVVINDGADTDTNNTTTVISNAVAPTASSITVTGSPVTNATSVSFLITFTESVSGVGASDFTIDGSGVTGSITGVTGSGTSRTVTVTSVSGTGTLSIDLNSSGTSITDTGGKAISGGFTAGATHTVDTEGPTLTSSSPTDNDTDVPLSQNIELTFSENIAKGSGNITIFKSSDDSVFETINVTSGSVTIATTVATINPTSDFELNTEYYVQIPSGTFLDAASNSYSGISNKTDLNFTSIANQTNSFTSSGNWSDTSKWSLGRLPIASDNITVNTGATINMDVSSATINDFTTNSFSGINIFPTSALTISGNLTQNGTFNILSNASTNGSLIVQGTSTGNVSYLRHVSTNWHLIGAPVEGQSINSLSGEVETNGNNFAIAPYLNSTTSLLRWNYYTTNAGTNDIASSGNFLAAKGYTFKKKTVAGTVTFTGTINTEDQPISITDGGDNPSGNRWNLVANPYTAALNASNAADATNNFLKVNIDAGNLDPTKAGLYLWTGTTPYDVKSVDDAAFYIAPGQAFFVHAPDGGGTSVSFTEAMQSHQTGNIFLKNTTSYPEIILNLSGGKSKSLTKIRYIQGKTTGLDVGSDVGTFTGTGKSNFEVYSHLVNSKFEDDFAIQALPNSNFEEMIVPIGVSAKSGQEISFSAALSNLPVGLSVFLEDKENNTLTELSDADRNYSIALNKDLNGTGRFYIHTTSNALSIDNNDDLQNINIYTINTSTLRITGLSVEKNEIVIFNMLGKQVFSTSFIANNVKDINLLNLSAGIYFVQLQNNSGKLTKKIILE